MTSTEDRDLLEGYDSVPSVSFDPNRVDDSGKRGVAENQWLRLTVRDYINGVQAKDDDGKLLFHEDTGNPVMKAVLPVTMEDGEDRSLWMKVIRKHEGALFRELVDEQKRLRKELDDPNFRIGPGAKLAIRWSWNTAVPKKMGNHPKRFEVKVVPGPPPAPKDDVLGDENTGGDPWAEPASSTMSNPAGVAPGSTSTPAASGPTPPQGDPFGDATPDDEPPF